MITFRQHDLESAYPDLIPKIESEIPYARKFVERKMSSLGISDAIVDVSLGRNGGFYYSAKFGTLNGDAMEKKKTEDFSSNDLLSVPWQLDD